MHKFYTICITLLALPLILPAQIAIRGLHFRPTGDQGILFEKKFTGELMYMSDFDGDRIRSRAGLSYVPLNARLDTFPIYATKIDGDGTHILPGYEVYHKYSMGFLFAGIDFAFINKEPFYLFIGCDVLVGGIDMDYEYEYETYTSYSFSGGQYLGGLRFRLGAEYVFKKQYGIFAEINRSIYGVEETGWESHYDYGIGFHYIFK